MLSTNALRLVLVSMCLPAMMLMLTSCGGDSGGGIPAQVSYTAPSQKANGFFIVQTPHLSEPSLLWKDSTT